VPASLQLREKRQRLQQAIKANEAAFIAAVDEIAAISGNLLSSLETNTPSRNRTQEAANRTGKMWSRRV
jgi:hypothetical protein